MSITKEIMLEEDEKTLQLQFKPGSEYAKLVIRGESLDGKRRKIEVNSTKKEMLEYFKHVVMELEEDLGLQKDQKKKKKR